MYWKSSVDRFFGLPLFLWFSFLKTSACVFLLNFLALRKDNVLGVLNWWRTPKSVSSSPGWRERPSMAHLIALELISFDASWITTTLWIAVDTMLLPVFGALIIRRFSNQDEQHRKGSLLWTHNFLGKTCLLQNNGSKFDGDINRDHAQ